MVRYFMLGLVAAAVAGAVQGIPATKYRWVSRADAETIGPQSNCDRPGISQTPSAMWIWNTAGLLRDPKAQAEFFSFARDRKIVLIFLQVIYDVKKPFDQRAACELRYQAELRSFLAKAHAFGVRVHALEGYPELALDRYRPQALALVRAVLTFNASAGPAKRFDGLHFDNEPYLLLGFDSPNKGLILSQFVQFSREVAQLLGKAPDRPVLGIDVPFWFDELTTDCQGATQSVTRCVLGMVDNLGLMDYRVTAGGLNGLVAHARRTLEEAAELKRTVYVGVDSSRAAAVKVHFVYGVKKSEWMRLARAAAPFTFVSHLDGYPLRLLDDGERIHVGLAELPDAPGDDAALKAALLKLYAVYGATAEGRVADLARTGARVRSVLRRSSELNGFEPFVLHEGARTVPGFITVAATDPAVTFAGHSIPYMESILGAAGRELACSPAFGGFAINDYRSYRAMSE